MSITIASLSSGDDLRSVDEPGIWACLLSTRYQGMHRVLPSPKRGFPGTEHPGIVWLIPTLTEHTHLRALKASIAPTHQANKSCADYLARPFSKIGVVRVRGLH